MAEDILNQLWQIWDMVWYRLQTEANTLILVVVATVAILYLVRLFLVPRIRKK
jgi:hypothetical protein